MRLPVNYEFYALAGDVAIRSIQYLVDGAITDISEYAFRWAFDVRGHTAVATNANEKIYGTAAGIIYLVLPELDTAPWVGRGRHILTITSPVTRTLLEGEVIML